jgi:Uma2 family endonuclease
VRDDGPVDNPSTAASPSYAEPMTATVTNYRWSASEFVRAWEAGAFDSRVELVEGQVWPVAVGDWHGRAVGRVILALGRTGLRPTTSTLPSGTSLPDPDCWVRKEGAHPSSTLGRRLSTWSPADVLLVVEVSDETLMADLTTKARVYGSAGWPEYWVVSPEAVYVHTGPHSQGYRQRVEHRRGEQVPLPVAGATVAVDELIG